MLPCTSPYTAWSRSVRRSREKSLAEERTSQSSARSVSGRISKLKSTYQYRLSPTSINCLAFCKAASCRTWFITAALGSEGEPPKPRELLMLSIVAISRVFLVIRRSWKPNGGFRLNRWGWGSERPCLTIFDDWMINALKVGTSTCTAQGCGSDV